MSESPAIVEKEDFSGLELHINDIDCLKKRRRKA